MVFLMLLTGFLVAGMKSRWCALLMGLVMALSALYKHPWFITMWSKSTFALDFVVGYEDVYVDAWLYSDHQRYFFFQLSPRWVRCCSSWCTDLASTRWTNLRGPCR